MISSYKKERDIMAVGSDKTRTIITLPTELKMKLEELAEQDNRSLNNLMVKILIDYVESIEK